MYERRYGYLYKEAGDASNTEVAKMIRRDVKLACEEGLLPTRWTYSVRSDGLSVDLDVRDCADAWQECDGMNCHNVWCSARNDPQYAHAATPHKVLTEEAKAARMTLDRIHGAYNHDGSEIMVDYFDVRYYGHVSFESDESADFRKREAERLAAKKAAKDAGTPKRLYRNLSSTGRIVTHLTIETPEGKEVLACGARLSRSSLGDLRDIGTAEVTCTRCAKRLGRAASPTTEGSE